MADTLEEIIKECKDGDNAAGELLGCLCRVDVRRHVRLRHLLSIHFRLFLCPWKWRPNDRAEQCYGACFVKDAAYIVHTLLAWLVVGACSLLFYDGFDGRLGCTSVQLVPRRIQTVYRSWLLNISQIFACRRQSPYNVRQPNRSGFDVLGYNLYNSALVLQTHCQLDLTWVSCPG